jgi:hypothetical protein
MKDRELFNSFQKSFRSRNCDFLENYRGNVKPQEAMASLQVIEIKAQLEVVTKFLEQAETKLNTIAEEKLELQEKLTQPEGD